MDETIIRIDATCHLKIRLGDRIRRGEPVCEGADAEGSLAPVSGTVKSIQFDPDNHEFVISIAPTA